MKRILYDTAIQALVNRAVHFTGRREKAFYMNMDQSTTQLSILFTNPVKSDPIYKNIIQIMGYCGIFLVRGRGAKASNEEGTKKILERGDIH